MYEKETPLTEAILDNDIEKVKQLINDGVDINEKNKLEEPPIIITSYTREEHINLEILKLLLENGADPAIGDEE
ncbi:hypothetical protein V7101_20025, partial [Bacillus velezensis]